MRAQLPIIALILVSACNTDKTEAPDTSELPDVTELPDVPPLEDVEETSDGASDTCEGQYLYFGPGCGDVSPTCVTWGLDACAGTACSCSGQTVPIGCGFHSQPFASYGECPGDPDLDATMGD